MHGARSDASDATSSGQDYLPRSAWGGGSDRNRDGRGRKGRLSAGIVDIISSSIWVLMMGRWDRFEGFIPSETTPGCLSEALEQLEADKCGGIKRRRDLHTWNGRILLQRRVWFRLFSAFEGAYCPGRVCKV